VAASLWKLAIFKSEEEVDKLREKWVWTLEGVLFAGGGGEDERKAWENKLGREGLLIAGGGESSTQGRKGRKMKIHKREKESTRQSCWRTRNQTRRKGRGGTLWKGSMI